MMSETITIDAELLPRLPKEVAQHDPNTFDDIVDAPEFFEKPREGFYYTEDRGDFRVLREVIDEARLEAHGNALEDAPAEERFLEQPRLSHGQHGLGKVGVFAYRIHPDVTNLKEAREVQVAYDAGELSIATIAMEAIEVRTMDRLRTAKKKLAGFATSLVARLQNILPETQTAAAEPLYASEIIFSTRDRRFLNESREHYLELDRQTPRTSLARNFSSGDTQQLPLIAA